MTTSPALDAGWSRTVLADRRVHRKEREQVRETTRRLIAGSLAGLLVLVLGGYLLGARLAERQVVTDAKRFSALLAHGLVGPRLTPALLAGDPQARQELDSLIQHRLVPRTSLRRVKIWSEQGQVLYSDDPREIGRVHSLTPPQLAALRTGKTLAEVSDLSRDEHRYERELGPRLLETYTGLRGENGQRFLFEMYMSYDQIREQRAAVFRTLAGLGVAGVLLFAGFQLALGRMTLRWVRRKQDELDEHASVVAERARQRMARDIHDGTLQDLVGTSYLVNGALHAIRRRQLSDEERLLERAADSVRSGIQSLRSVMIEVYPRTIQERGLTAALIDLGEPLRTRGLHVDVHVALDGYVSPQTDQALYRAAQEALRNVMQHAHATAVHIRVAASGQYVLMEIVDNGIGMPPGPVESPQGHLGLSVLTDTVVERDGYLEIRSAPGRGTHIRMEMQR